MTNLYEPKEKRVYISRNGKEYSTQKQAIHASLVYEAQMKVDSLIPKEKDDIYSRRDPDEELGESKMRNALAGLLVNKKERQKLQKAIDEMERLEHGDEGN